MVGSDAKLTRNKKLDPTLLAETETLFRVIKLAATRIHQVQAVKLN